ncbi:MAG TPA: monofunctional biosynthetic peptidoglycan transglycosylase [Saprospiraceae bacterium]|nr:monofunctional biosynthetic peptidoglycan transglycosylase [Saprospiraceae bacterium]
MQLSKEKIWKWSKKYIPRFIIGFISITLIWVIIYRWVSPPGTLLMLSRQISVDRGNVDYRWVDSDKISANLKTCAIASEDQNFPYHYGFDIEAIQKAVKFNAKHKRTRGASTISQQVAKNVFLWEGRSWLRKGLELYFTLLIELLWSKDRILEMYLNVAEMGPLTFGAQAASKKYFRKNASQLSPQEAAKIIAILPSPLKWSVNHPGPFVAKRQVWILSQFYMLGGNEYLKEL